MDTLLSLKVFRQVVQNGSFTRAAEQLGISTAMASKHVSHLEKSIQAKLLHRNSRNLNLTEAGEEYYRQCTYALETLETAAEKAAGGAERPQGHLRITVPVWCANPAFARWMAEYRAAHPDVQLDITLDNHMSDLIAEGFDLALRVSSNPSPSLIVRPLFEVRFDLVATPDYLRRQGTPQTPEEANLHAAVLPSYTDMSRVSITSAEHSLPLNLHAALSSNNTLMLYQLILAGNGIGYLPSWLSAPDIAAGRLTRLLPDYHIKSLTLHAAYVDRQYLSAKVRSFIDFLSRKATIFKP